MEKSKSSLLAVSKRVLLLVAGLVWGFAGLRVFTLGKGDVVLNKGNVFISIVFSITIFYIFFNFIFKKIFIKHAKRIINSKLEKQCIFSFFDIKGYIVMGCMMTFGIVIRNLGVLDNTLLGNFYIGLGAALFLAGLTFLISSINFEETKVKYSM
ncbi:MAG: hypothetical protein E7E64_04520 [Clostridium celatum]|nr:hypothetical protein [Clostridium celatum]MDU4979694.1 hypothetical protein [Clostridium celatum]